MTSAPPRTMTMPHRPPPGWAPDRVTGLRLYGRADDEYLLPSDREKFSIGTAQSDVLLAEPYVSTAHCSLVRRGHRISVHDLHSKNGTFYRGKREAVFDIGPGDWFKVARTKLLTISDPMRELRPEVADVIGHDEHVMIDGFFVAASGEQPMLLLGEPGCGQDRLVRAIHRVSPLAPFPIVEETAPPAAADTSALIERATARTVVLPIVGKKLDPALLAAAFDRDRHIRLVVLAETARIASRALGAAALKRFHEVELVPARRRKDEIEHLVDRALARHDAELRTRALTDANRAVLLAHKWTGTAGSATNLDEIADYARKIAAIVAAGGVLAKAANALDMTRKSLDYWIEKSDLELPLVPWQKEER